MSIVAYENVDTPVFEIDFLRYLFANGEAGLLLSYLPDYLYADVDKTVPAVFGGGIASFDDLSGNGVAGPQSVSTARPIFRASPARGEYDSADDVLPKDATLPAITDGTVILIGQQGIWIDEGYSFAGGDWSFGPTTYTDGPDGIIGVVGDMLDLVVLDRPLTPSERDKVVAYGVKRGSAGLFELGDELVVNGTFDSDTSSWASINNSALSVSSQRLAVQSSGEPAPGARQDVTVVSGQVLMLGVRLWRGTTNPARTIEATVVHATATVNLVHSTDDALLRGVYMAPEASGWVRIRAVSTSTAGEIFYADDVSLRPLTLVTP